MEVKLTVSQIVLAIVQLAGYICTAIGIAYYFGKKVSSFEVTMKHAMEKWEDVTDEVKLLSQRMWEEKGQNRTGRR